MLLWEAWFELTYLLDHVNISFTGFLQQPAFNKDPSSLEAVLADLTEMFFMGKKWIKMPDIKMEHNRNSES